MQCIDNVDAIDAACSVARDRHYCLVHTCVSPRNCALDRAQISPWDAEILGARVKHRDHAVLWCGCGAYAAHYLHSSAAVAVRTQHTSPFATT